MIPRQPARRPRAANEQPSALPRNDARTYSGGVETDPRQGADTTAHVVLVHPEIAWNVGNAGRTCLATGAQLHLVRPLGFSLDEPSVRRAGLDYWEHVHPIVWTSWEELEPRLGELGEPFFFSAEAGRVLWEVAFPPQATLVFGRESVGLPANLRERYRDWTVRIPMAPGPVRSLNLSTSVAVALFEMQRQRLLRR